ncbi:MAG: amidase, partial [Candidatus Rokuibacteriota bacterium]
LRGGVKGLRVAYSDTLGYAEVVDPEVREACGKAARAFRELGCRVEEIDPGWPSPFAAWRAIFAGGIATRLASYTSERDKIDAGLLRIVDEALKSPPTAFVQAFFDRLAWLDHPRRLFEGYDLLLTPTLARPAFAVGLDNATEIAGRPVPEWAWSPFTYPFNLTGQPAASVPCGFTRGGLPIGLQVVGRRFDDATVLRASAAFEAARPWAQNRPPLP